MSAEDSGAGAQVPPPAGFGDPSFSGESRDSDSEAPADAETTSDLWGLRNTDASVSPSDVGRQLDVEADWWQHVGAGFVKMSGSEGTEAWMNLAMGVLLLVLELTNDRDGETSGDTRGSENNGLPAGQADIAELDTEGPL